MTSYYFCFTSYKKIGVFLSFIFCLSSLQAKEMTPKNALHQLMEGNRRFVQEKLDHPNRSKEARHSVLGSQTPFAAIISCADSRVAPEIIFDQGVGDLFVIRVAGNVLGATELESALFAINALGVSLVMICGHEHCGAVKAVINHQSKDIPVIAHLIYPAVVQTKTMSNSHLTNAIKQNAINMANNLKDNPNVTSLIKKGKLDVIAGYYEMQSGKVEILNTSSI